MMKPAIYCVLDFFQSASSLMSLCVSSYGLAYSIGKPWMWNNIIIVGCISTTIACNAFRQSFDKLYLEKYIIREAAIMKKKEEITVLGQDTFTTTTSHHPYHYPPDITDITTPMSATPMSATPMSATPMSAFSSRPLNRVQSMQIIPRRQSFQTNPVVNTRYPTLGEKDEELFHVDIV